MRYPKEAKFTLWASNLMSFIEGLSKSTQKSGGWYKENVLIGGMDAKKRCGEQKYFGQKVFISRFSGWLKVSEFTRDLHAYCNNINLS